MKELVSNLIEAYEARINNLEWMDASTKSKAIEKLKKTTVKVGYPDQWEDYQKLSLKDSEGGATYLGAVLNISRFYFMKDLEDLKKPVDKTKWFMPPQTVNAYYNPTYNEIVFPAAILQPLSLILKQMLLLITELLAELLDMKSLMDLTIVEPITMQKVT